MTTTVRIVLGAFLDDPSREWYGRELMPATGLHTGTVYPILARLESVGWLDSRWEELDTRAAGRPPRRYYRLTRSGMASAGLR